MYFNIICSVNKMLHGKLAFPQQENFPVTTIYHVNTAAHTCALRIIYHRLGKRP